MLLGLRYLSVVLLCLCPFAVWSQLLPEEDFVGKGEELLELERSLYFRADDVYVNVKDGVVEARGNVRVEGQGIKLHARTMYYNLATRKLRLEGRVAVEIGSYGSVMTERIDIDLDKNHAVTEAVHGLFFNYHKFAAASSEIDLDDKEMNVLRGTYTFCPVCTEEEREEGGSLIPKPVWQLKVGQIQQGDNGRYIVLKNISLELFTVGLPLLFFPELRLLSPEIERESGFLFLQGGVNPAGVFFGIPYFIGWGEDTNILLSPYLGTSHSLLGVNYESVGKHWELESKSLWKAQTGEKREAKDSEVARWGVEGDYTYGIDESWRVRGEWDVVSDTYFTKDYKGLYDRNFPRYAPSVGDVNVEVFDREAYGALTVGFADNLYGDTPLYDQFLGGDWWRLHEGGEGTRWREGVRFFSVGERYDSSHWEDVEPGVSDEKHSSSFGGGEASVEREARRVGWGFLLESRLGLHGFFRREEGSLYDRVSFRSPEGWVRPDFYEVEEDSREWLEWHSKLIVRWPWVREEEGDKWLVTPFAGVTKVSHLLGERKRGVREEWYLPHRQSFESASRTPVGEGLDISGFRMVFGSDVEFSREGLRDVSLYGGVSTRVGDAPEEVSLRSLDNDVFFGGGKVLWGTDKILTYDVIRDLKRGVNVKEQVGLRFNWDESSRFDVGYTHVDNAESHLGLSIVEARVKSWLTEEFEIEGSVDRDVSGGGYYEYSTTLSYVVPCLKLGVTWNESLRRNHKDVQAQVDSRIFFSVNIFTDQAYSQPSWQERN